MGSLPSQCVCSVCQYCSIDQFPSRSYLACSHESIPPGSPGAVPTVRHPQPVGHQPAVGSHAGELHVEFVPVRRVTVAGEEAQLTATEYDLLAELAVNAGRVVTHEELLQRVWGPVNPGSPRTIRTHLMRLRQKLGEDGDNPTYVFSEPRVGYRMAVGESADTESEIG